MRQKVISNVHNPVLKGEFEDYESSAYASICKGVFVFHKHDCQPKRNPKTWGEPVVLIKCPGGIF